eukprot:3230408-Lingulodinium_polyedra.AAC.1
MFPPPRARPRARTFAATGTTECADGACPSGRRHACSVCGKGHRARDCPGKGEAEGKGASADYPRAPH